MKLVIIFGPHAVGKMTVGQELSKLTGLKLFHGHMTIDLAAEFFTPDKKECWELTEKLRREVFDAVLKSDLYGIIFTYMWAFDEQSNWDYVKKLYDLFCSRGAEIYFVELEADYDLRLERNKTPNRLAHKLLKRDLKASERVFRTLEEKYRVNSQPGEVEEKYANYLRIDNTDISAEEAAKTIRDTFNL